MSAVGQTPGMSGVGRNPAGNGRMSGVGQTPVVDDRGSGRRTAAQHAGDAAEALAADRLVELGWTVLSRNVRIGRKEVDIVALDPGPPSSIVLVEVRWRAKRDYGLAEETFDWRKRRHLRAAVGRLAEAGALPGGPPLEGRSLRVDLIVVEPASAPATGVRIRHHRDALGG